MQSFDRFKSVSGLRIGIESVLPDLEIVEVPTAEGGEGPVEPWPPAPSLFRPFLLWSNRKHKKTSNWFDEESVERLLILQRLLMGRGLASWLNNNVLDLGIQLTESYSEREARFRINFQGLRINLHERLVLYSSGR